ncbi:TPA: pyocin knob domain-containing protein [Enterobacter ludwigii]
MILGFGNNVVSSLASDITASQTTFSVIPGDGPLFASLLTSDFSNKSTTLKNYAKITLTDSGETAFEVCHLTAVNGDTLTVIRGQEGTAAKGWALKDVVANFATRGSENSFPQIAHIQSGFYTSGTAGGTANALTLELPTTFFLNGSADWVLKTPLVVYPSQNNTGAATLQLTMGGRVLGTFPLYKGNKAALVANDILKDVALVCLMDNTKTFFNVANPGAIYAGLGTAAFKDVVTSQTDTTAGRVLNVGWQGLGGATQIAMGKVSQFLANTDSTKPEYPSNGTGFQACYAPNRRGQLFLTTDNGLHVRFTLSDSAIDSTTPWVRVYTTSYKPSAADVGALPVSSSSLTVDLNTLGRADSRGIYYQATNAGATAANHYPVQVAGTLYVTPSAYGSQQMYVTYTNRIFIRAVTGSFTGTGPWSDWVEMYSPNNKPNSDAVNCIARDGSHVGGFANGDATRPYMRHTASNAVVTLAKAGDSYTKAESDNGYMPKTGAYTKAESDGRFQPKGNYTPAGQAYTKAESDARYQLKNTASRATNGWFKDTSTGMITQWGTVSLPASNGRVTSASFNFSTAFPNAVLSIVTSPGNSRVNNGGFYPVTAVIGLTNSGGTISADSNAGENFTLTQTIRYIAIGY